ncbi:uncharacterized protein PGTG_18083 [Puccinia graminis f. sp. tritici CRL 75-36-700-3]|uniref:Uncharacterized protein n=1 Tax=Puccinia graminis f. sp. tritici (strain CRL 75-36-700-3 / race SCCL) TaxID=418459 RepID=E3L6L1_PUCGT|nr:uncharacterized protein PGTG_18083 [Puccinia graminis f. sp. tritici CRL 75-36-700-3]EFP92186.1 hypothetical protein PGTG_18083 [Puccinia graminis f. sp. tritici CRL 75-36-700-3]
MAPDPGPLPSCPNHNQPPVAPAICQAKSSIHRIPLSIVHIRRSHLSDQPITITSFSGMAHSSNGSGQVPPLPFSNPPDGSQESWLGPSQSADRAESFRLFHDNNPCTESQFKAAANATRAYKLAHSNGGPTPPQPDPPRPHLRPIYLDYLVYNRSVASQLGQSSGSKEWDCVTPPTKSETVWKVDLAFYSWAKCQREVIKMCGSTCEHIEAHLHRLQREGLLKWQCILHRDGLFAQNKNYYVKDDAGFSPFVQAVNNATNKAMIKIIMDDPTRSAKDSEEAKKVADSLALNYADEDTRLALQRVHTRLAANPKADVKYGCDAESMRVRNPDNPKRSIRVTTDALRAWSRAMLHGAPGVNFDNPPKCKECIPEDVAVLTLDELASKQEARMSRHTRTSSPSKRSSSGSKSPMKSPAVGVPGTPLFLGDKPSGLVFTPARRSASGRILPPRLMPGEALQSVDQSAALARRSSIHTNSASISVNSDSEAVRVDLVGAEDYEDLTGPSGHQEDSWRPSTPVEDDVPRDVSTLGTDIEVLPAGTVLRSPSRKLARSPVGDGIVHNFSRLEFERPRSPSRYLSVSPTRKRPGSQASSYPSVDMSNKAPLNELGRALSIDGFLRLCNFTDDDHVPRVLISLSHIRRWDFFLDTNFYVLQKMGFPYPIATQLLKGAKWLEATHVQPSHPGKPTLESSPKLPCSAGPDPKSLPEPAPATHDRDAPPVAGPSRAGLACSTTDGDLPESIPDSSEADDGRPSLDHGGSSLDPDYQPSPKY